jgi:peptidoglycan L-alanyl-D-glutamate endopeptidase CwlK
MHPKLREMYTQHMLACAREGIDVLMYCAWRSPEEQDYLYGQGRTRPGKKLTNAKAGQSKHNHMEGGKPASLAYDCIPLVAGKPAWNNAELVARVGEIGESVGLKWAGRWVRFKESVHFEVSL